MEYLIPCLSAISLLAGPGLKLIVPFHIDKLIQITSPDVIQSGSKHGNFLLSRLRMNIVLKTTIATQIMMNKTKIMASLSRAFIAFLWVVVCSCIILSLIT